MRDTILFSGASHTFGLGLEWELDEELNSEEYLQNGIHIPIPRPDSYQKYWREYRWPTLVCNELGYKQYNIHDSENAIKIGGNAVETLWMLVRDENKIQNLLPNIKYIVLEVGGIRWYDESLHGGIDGDKYPNTIQEMINLINNPNSDIGVVGKTLDWIREFDAAIYTKEIYNKIEYLNKKYPDITFLIFHWHIASDIETLPEIIRNNSISIEENGKKYNHVHKFLQENQLCVYHKAKGWNGNYTYNYKEDHASIEGHQRVANMVIKHIKQLEENESRV